MRGMGGVPLAWFLQMSASSRARAWWPGLGTAPGGGWVHMVNGPISFFLFLFLFLFFQEGGCTVLAMGSRKRVRYMRHASPGVQRHPNGVPWSYNMPMREGESITTTTTTTTTKQQQQQQRTAQRTKPSKADLGEPHPTLWVTKRCYAACERGWANARQQEGRGERGGVGSPLSAEMPAPEKTTRRLHRATSWAASRRHALVTQVPSRVAVVGCTLPPSWLPSISAWFVKKRRPNDEMEI